LSSSASLSSSVSESSDAPKPTVKSSRYLAQRRRKVE
jgi:hypothetical protein